MAAGASANLNATQVNGTAGALAKEVESLFARIKEFQTFLAATDLKAAPYSMTSGDEADVKSAFSNLNELVLVYEGRGSVGNANGARTFVGRLVGFGPHN